MNFPRINKSPARTVNVPVLSGGVNKRDGITLIADNQMTNMENVFFQSGLLKTRTNIVGSSNAENIPLKENFGAGAEVVDIRVFGDVSGRFESDIGDYIECILTAVKVQVEGGTKIILLLASPDGHINDESEQIIGEYDDNIEGEGTCSYINYSVPASRISYFAVNCSDKSYLYVASPENNIFDIYEILGYESRLIPKSEIYAPLVLVSATACDPTYWELNGVQWESYNMLTNRYKVQYTSVNKSALKPPSDNPEGEPCHEMTYRLPKRLPDVRLMDDPLYKDMCVEVVITYKNGVKVTHTAHASGNSNAEESRDPGDGLLLTVTGNGFGFTAVGDKSKFKTLTKDDYVENNMEVTAFFEWDFEQVKNVMCQTRAKWFGGGAEGLMGGTRLFLCGNREDSKQSLVVWSAKDKPLYFPQNNRFNVGKANYPVLGFGLQSEMLVIFKPHEVFYTYYATNSDITAEDIINQNVIDYESTAVYFPLVTITDEIGCDCPDTVCLCRNRLVWLNSNGKVYTLVSNNNYNERLVFCVSEMLGQDIKNLNYDVGGDLTGAKAVDFNDYYMLFVKDRVYVLDYNSYGFTYISSYTKTEDANIKIPWHIWSLPIEPKAVLQSHSNLGFMMDFNYDGKIAVDCIKLGDGGGNDILSVPKPVLDSNLWVIEREEIPIESTFTTKFFDFGVPFHDKEIKRVDIGFGGGADTEIDITYITNEGERNTSNISLCGELTPHSPEFIRPKQLMPGIKFARNFALKVSGIGYMAVEGISITCRLLGGSK